MYFIYRMEQSVAFLCEPRVNVFVSECLLSMAAVILHVLNVSENYVIMSLLNFEFRKVTSHIIMTDHCLHY